MRHGRARALLDDYADGLLPARDVGRLEHHLASCGDCRRDLEELRRTLDLLRALPREEAPLGLETRILAHLREANQTAPRGGLVRLRGWLGPLAAATGVLAVLAMVQGVEVRVGWPGASAGPGPLAAAPAQPASRPEVTAQRVARFAPDAPVPSLSACLDHGESAACSRFHHWLLDLAMRDEPAFLDEIEEVPAAARSVVLRDLHRLAWSSGAGPLVVDRLGSSADPRAQPLARRLVRVSSH